MNCAGGSGETGDADVADNKGFVPLTSLTQGPPTPRAALEEIRRIYFKTTRQTIEHDLAHAIELLKSLPSDDEREKATVYMEGLAQMLKEFGKGGEPKGKGQRSKSKGKG